MPLDPSPGESAAAAQTTEGIVDEENSPSKRRKVSSTGAGTITNPDVLPEGVKQTVERPRKVPQPAKQKRPMAKGLPTFESGMFLLFHL